IQFIMKKVFITALLLSQYFAHAQSGEIKGKILEQESKLPVVYATVSLSKDGTIVTGELSAEDGSFIIQDIPYGTYDVKIEYIGFKDLDLKATVEANQKKVDLGTVYLEINSEELQSIEIVAERSTMEQLVDRKVIKVGKDLSTAGATAADIMGNVPSVNIDQDR